jgi:hypothetical protein
MQVNSAQDYLTAQKRRIVAASFTVDPPPAHRKYNYVYVSMLANKATQYTKVQYPQTLSLAPGGQTAANGPFVAGSVPGGVYTAAGVLITQRTQADRPVFSDCAGCPAATGLPGSLI